MSMMSMDGKVALVTGAARGLGAAFAMGFAEIGMAVVVSDLRDCTETAEAVKAAGGKAIAIETDVTDAKSTQAMADAAVKEFGRIDVLMNNAAMYGNLHSGRFTDLEEDEWDACMAVNVKGLWQCAKAAVPEMRKQEGGSIISISSLAAVYGMPNALHYATSKGAVIGLTRALARELGRHNIRVNAIAPTMVNTDGTREMMGDQLERFAEVVRNNQTLRSNLDSDDLVGTAVYLASDMSKFVTGQTLMVDGGTVYR